MLSTRRASASARPDFTEHLYRNRAVERSALTLEKQRPQRHSCPRCHTGFLVFDGTVGGDDGICINCGYRAPAPASLAAANTTIEAGMPRLSHEPRLPGERIVR